MKSPQKRKRLSTATPQKRCTSATPKKRGASATPEKLRKKSTSKKKLLVSGLNDGCSGKMINPTHGEHASQSVPDLRLEAKLQAEVCQILLYLLTWEDFFPCRILVFNVKDIFVHLHIFCSEDCTEIYLYPEDVFVISQL